MEKRCKIKIRGLHDKYIERPEPESFRFYYSLQDPVDRYAIASKYVQDKTVLDVACGIAYCSRLLKRHSARRVVGGDISAEAINWASKHYSMPGLDFSFLTTDHLPFKDGSFDVVVSVETIEHLPRQEVFLSECYRILNNGGRLIVVTPNRIFESKGSEVPLNPFHVREFSETELYEKINQYFDEVTVMGISPVSAKRNILVALRMILLPKMVAVFGNLVPRSINLVTKFAFRKYRLVRLVDFTDDDFDPLWVSASLGKREPYELKPERPMPRNLIAIARKHGH